MVELKEKVKQESRKKTEAGESGAKSRFILIIDDDPVTNYLNKKVLLHFGSAATIKTFEIGHDALCLVEELNESWFKIDELCILLDLQMLEMDGIEFLKRLSGIELKVSVRVYILSGSMPVNRLHVLSKFSLAGFFLKPLSKGNVKEILMPLNPVFFN